MENESLDKLKFAARFVNNTKAPIFLTGKAGTGKTTFLKSLAEQTHKNYVVAAPTGIAALNAGGVTIHSLFQLPFGFFLPEKEPEGNFSSQYNCFTQYTLTRKHLLSAQKRSVLKSIELLVIDEVSMLRADVLDAIDYRLRSVKRNYQVPFGGVQVLMIGDLYQLPPIVKNEEWSVLQRYYSSIHFFEAKVLKDAGLVYLELDKIFRQSDETFINLLNHLRENRVTQEDVQLLNTHYKSEREISEINDCITLTTHNYKADQINRQKLDELKTTSHYYQAEVDQDFPENLFPIPESLELKEGAQVMFIKNDSSGNGDYFNGKLARVESLSEEGIEVILEGNTFPYRLKRELWENKKYVLHPDTKELEEDVIGSFSQYPIKLAWAVTVHKSQGLTFDRAVIDVGHAFAPGQVYVALSRLRSLDGLILKSKIRTDALQSDHAVQSFTQASGNQKQLSEILSQHQQEYLSELLGQVFNLHPVLMDLQSFMKKTESSMEFEDPEMQVAISTVFSLIKAESTMAERFGNQLRFLLQEKDFPKLKERLEKGSVYFKNFLEKALSQLLIHTAEVAHFSKTKTYLKDLEVLEVGILKKYGEINKVSRLVTTILNGETPNKMTDLEEEKSKLRFRLSENAKMLASENPKFSSTKTGKKKKGKASLKRKVGETYEITFAMIEEGKSIGDITIERGMAESTIKGHLARGIKEGKVSLDDCLPSEVIFDIRSAMDDHKSVTALRMHFSNKYDYGTIRMVVAGSHVED